LQVLDQGQPGGLAQGGKSRGGGFCFHDSKIVEITTGVREAFTTGAEPYQPFTRSQTAITSSPPSTT
jgi:hypothetical protein